LWSLLGDLPVKHRPKTPKLIKRGQGVGYSLEYLELDLNGLELVTALLLIPEKRQPRALGLLYMPIKGSIW
jgi:hypothetical protein